MDSNDVRRRWADRSGEYSPTYYAHYGPNETSDVIRRTLERHLDRDAPVLELGCSSGRHLAHLREHGFEDLSGVELNAEAFDVMADTYPDLAATGAFYNDAIEAVVEEFPTDHFGAVYSVETLQHLHPDAEWVFDELARITDDVLMTAENENGDDYESGGEHENEIDSRNTDASSPAPAVNYVNDELPLYYRDWQAVFTDRGFTEVSVDTTRRDTVRTFRTTD